MRHALLLCLALAGCAGMNQEQCAGANWTQLGERDGLTGTRPWVEQYDYQCSRYNLRAAEKDYMDGWWVGYAEFVRRADSHEGPN
jgi:hypothetical protein